MRSRILGAAAAVGGALSYVFGGWDASMNTLLILMGIDYVTGLVAAGVFHASNKTKTGTLSSNAGFLGLCRKGAALLLVLVGARLDVTLGTTFVKDGVCAAFILNETLSVTENVGAMGVPIPAPVRRAVELLRSKGEGSGGDK